MEFCILWIGLCIIAGAIAANKGRSGVGFFFLAVVLSPIIGIAAALVARKDAQYDLNLGTHKQCPQCAEHVKSEARMCRFCRFSFVEAMAQLEQAPVGMSSPMVARQRLLDTTLGTSRPRDPDPWIIQARVWPS